MSAINNVPLWQLLQFAESYAKLGSAVREQLNDLVRLGNGAEVNENAIKMVLRELRPLPEEIKIICEAYLEGDGEGRYASSNDTALRAGLIRLAHARPDLRPHLLSLVSDKAVYGNPRRGGPRR